MADNSDIRPWVGATAATLAAWPALAAPLVDALATGELPIPAVPVDVVNRLAGELSGRMAQVAQASVRLTAHEAAAQGVADPGGTPDRDRIEDLAAQFAGIIAAGYTSVAAQAALTAPLTEAGRLKAAASAVAVAVRTALTALGSAASGLVPTQVGAAMAAAEHEGTIAVLEAHPPRYLVAAETHEDANRCEPCEEINGQRYEALAEALEDYPTVGYRLCRGGVRCRGRIRGVWSEDLAESAPTDLVEVAVAHSGAMIALVPSVEDAQRLAVGGGLDPDDLHLTLAYLGKADAIDAAARQNLIAAVTAACNGMPVVEADAFAPALFNPGGDEPCLVALLGGDLLDAIHHFLLETVPLPPVEQRAPWIPHVTLRFDDDVLRLSGILAATAGRMKTGQIGPIRFDRLRLAFAGQNIDIPLLPDDSLGDGDDGFEAWLADEGLAEADVHPGDARLKRYWLGKGLDKWATSPHPWTALYTHLRKYIKNTVLLKKTVSRWYIDHFHHTPNQKVAEAVAGAAEPVLVEVAIVESGAITDLHPDDFTDAEPLSDDEHALLAALAELDPLVEAFDASQARYPKGDPLGGRWRPMIDRLKDSIAAHRRGEAGHGDKHPLDGFSREQLRRVAKERGIELKRGEDRDSIAAKLLNHLGGDKPGDGGKSDDKKATKKTPAKAAKKTGVDDQPPAEPRLVKLRPETKQAVADAVEALPKSDDEWRTVAQNRRDRLRIAEQLSDARRAYVDAVRNRDSNRAMWVKIVGGSDPRVDTWESLKRHHPDMAEEWERGEGAAHMRFVQEASDRLAAVRDANDSAVDQIKALGGLKPDGSLPDGFVTPSGFFANDFRPVAHWEARDYPRDPAGVALPPPDLANMHAAVQKAGDAIHADIRDATDTDPELLRLRKARGAANARRYDTTLPGPERAAALDEATELSRLIKRRERELVKDALDQLRPMGGAKIDNVKPLTTQGDINMLPGPADRLKPARTDWREQLDEAAAHLPDDWVTRSNEAEMQVAATDRAYHQSVNGGDWRRPNGPGKRTLLAMDAEASSYYGGAFSSFGHEVTYHEMGHRLEEMIPGLKALEFAYVRSKTTKGGRVEPTVKLSDIRGSAYRPDEIAYRDEFPDPYTGKTYENADPANSNWEAFQVGLQDTFGRDDFRRYGDESLQGFVLGVVATLGRY